MNVREVLQRKYGKSGKINQLVGHDDLNFLLEVSNQKYIVKVHNSENEAPYIAQNKLLCFLTQSNLSIETPQVLLSQNGESFISSGGKILRVLSYVPGKVLSQISNIPWENLGYTFASLNSVLKNYSDCFFYKKSSWDLSHTLDLKNKISYLSDPIIINEVNNLMEAFEQKNIILNSLPEQLIHGDGNDLNIIVTGGCNKVSGVIDFGDAVYTKRVYELAILLSYAIFEMRGSLKNLKLIVNGYESITPLEKEERNLLPFLVKIRWMMSLLFASENKVKRPQNSYSYSSLQCAQNCLRSISEKELTSVLS